MAFKQISDFVSERGLLHDHQSGFRKGHSTHTALIRIVDDIRIEIDRNRVTLLVGIDYSLAFDLVNIKLLVHKLRSLGFSEPVCAWIESFLSNRSQVVALPDGKLSAPMARNAGVPQGSLLGPPFFSLFINDMPLVLKHCKDHLYADDHYIYLSGSFHDLPDVINKVNEDLQNISSWALDNGLIINAAKTQALWLGSRGYMSRLRNIPLPNIYLNGLVIEPSETLKILGITLDSTLSWRPQSNITAKKSFSALARLRKCGPYLPDCTKLTLVKALVFPYFDYCAGIFLDLSNELSLKVSRCKNAAIRFATGTKRYEHITPVYEKLEIPTFDKRRDFLIICLVASILKSNIPQYLAKHINFIDRHGNLRRSPLDLIIEKFETEYLRKSFFIGAAYLWNAVPEAIRSMYTRPCFKTMLFKHLLSVKNK